MHERQPTALRPPRARRSNVILPCSRSFRLCRSGTAKGQFAVTLRVRGPMWAFPVAICRVPPEPIGQPVIGHCANLSIELIRTVVETAHPRVVIEILQPGSNYDPAASESRLYLFQAIKHRLIRMFSRV